MDTVFKLVYFLSCIKEFNFFQIDREVVSVCKKTKKLIALLMTIIMIFAVCPVEIFAVDEDTALPSASAAAAESSMEEEVTTAPTGASIQ